MKRSRIGRTILIVIGLLMVLLAYALSYYVLTLQGAYVPSEFGLRQGPGGTTICAPKWYAWQPAGFARADGSWGRIVPTVYLPLYLIDRKWWHTDDERFSRKYPVRLHPADRVP